MENLFYDEKPEGFEQETYIIEGLTSLMDTMGYSIMDETIAQIRFYLKDVEASPEQKYKELMGIIEDLIPEIQGTLRDMMEVQDKEYGKLLGLYIRAMMPTLKKIGGDPSLAMRTLNGMSDPELQALSQGLGAIAEACEG
ncbi:hypothetical protein C6A37_08290 [Desulfobacteraceae bacterium SEEP-SAG9]|nr:hypothetical protein C6A37_08290 [Desulfobacteraceae bacterium SEEP-SAG9]